MRLGVKFLGNNNRSDILLLGVVNDLCKKKKHLQNVHQSIQASKFRASTTDTCLEVSMFVARGFQFTVKSNSGWVWFCFNFPYDCFRKLASPSRPIKCKTKTSINWITRVFPAFHWLLAIFPFALIGCCDYSFEVCFEVKSEYYFTRDSNTGPPL